MIPKIIHYCWFGRQPLSDQVKKCIQSWHKYCPEYEIKEWNEKNFDVQSSIYTAEAYKAEKYAFVSDFARFKILYQEGGIYFDTDVELIRPIDDLVSNGPFLACERSVNSRSVINPGLGFAAYAKMPILKDIIQIYKNLRFISPNNIFNQTTVVEYTTNYFLAHGFLGQDQVEVINGLTIYPSEYFAPMNYMTGELCESNQTRAVHHYAMSWLSEDYKRWIIRERILSKFIGIRASKYLIFIIRMPARIIIATRKHGLKEIFKIIIERVMK